MSESAHKHLKRQPLNLAAGDLQACLDYRNADDLRGVIDELRKDLNEQFRKQQENDELLARNIHNSRAVHPDFARRELHKTRSRLKQLLLFYMATSIKQPEQAQ